MKLTFNLNIMISAICVFLIQKFYKKETLPMWLAIAPVALAGGFWFAITAWLSNVLKAEGDAFMQDGPAALLIAAYFGALILEIGLHAKVLKALKKW